MGFPTGYTEVLLPKLLINTLSFLGVIRQLVIAFLGLMGLPDFLEPDVADFSARPEPICMPSWSISATLIRDMLPVERYSRPTPTGPDGPEGPGPAHTCAVCLYEYEEEEEIRRMRNCRHMFHRSCVDRWIDHDRKTCPLCRKPFVPEELQEEYNDKLWAASGIPDFYSEYSHITSVL